MYTRPASALLSNRAINLLKNVRDELSDGFVIFRGWPCFPTGKRLLLGNKVKFICPNKLNHNIPRNLHSLKPEFFFVHNHLPWFAVLPKGDFTRLRDPLLSPSPSCPPRHVRRPSLRRASSFFMAPSSVLKVKGSWDDDYGRSTTKTPVEVESV